MKLTKEILQNRSNEIHNNEYEIIGEYINSSINIKIHHKVCGSIFEQRPNNHLQGKGCKKCSGSEKGTKVNLQKKSDLAYNFTYEILGEYINNCSSLQIKHLTCDTIFYTTPSNHLRKNSFGCCTSCFRGKKKNKESLQEDSNVTHNNEYEILGEYINVDTKIEIRHKVCNSTFYQTPYKHINNNRCPICYGNKKLNKEILQERSDKIHNGEYEIISEYINSITPILIRHKICNSEYYQTPNNHLKGRICYNCRGSQSTGEKIIDNFLRENNINFIYNNSLLDCIYNDYKLRFDFYLPDYNMCIEYDGEQHFYPIDKFGGQKQYNDILKRDIFKNEWCKSNNIELIRIPYTEKSLKNKLNSIFKNGKI